MPRRKTTPSEEYLGEEPRALAEAIERALAKHGWRTPERLFGVISFYEGELALIARALRALPE